MTRVRDATQRDVEQLKRENRELKQLLADLPLEAYRLKKNPSRCLRSPTVPADERCGEGKPTYRCSLIPLPK